MPRTFECAQQILHRGVECEGGHSQEQTQVPPDVGQEIAPRVEIDFLYGLDRGTGTECPESFSNFKSFF